MLTKRSRDCVFRSRPIAEIGNNNLIDGGGGNKWIQYRKTTTLKTNSCFTIPNVLFLSFPFSVLSCLPPMVTNKAEHAVILNINIGSNSVVEVKVICHLCGKTTNGEVLKRCQKQTNTSNMFIHQEWIGFSQK